MDKMEIIMQALASPQARNVAGNVNDAGQNISAPILWNTIISVVICAVISDRL